MKVKKMQFVAPSNYLDESKIPHQATARKHRSIKAASKFPMLNVYELTRTSLQVSLCADDGAGRCRHREEREG
jgi:hypothetical protein